MNDELMQRSRASCDRWTFHSLVFSCSHCCSWWCSEEKMKMLYFRGDDMDQTCSTIRWVAKFSQEDPITGYDGGFHLARNTTQQWQFGWLMKILILRSRTIDAVVEVWSFVHWSVPGYTINKQWNNHLETFTRHIHCKFNLFNYCNHAQYKYSTWTACDDFLENPSESTFIRIMISLDETMTSSQYSGCFVPATPI